MTDSLICSSTCPIVQDIVISPKLIEGKILVSVEQLAEAFADMDNHQMLRFLQHAVHTLNKHSRYAACDQFSAVVNGSDIDDDTVTALYHLQRMSGYTQLQSYKPRT